jgi:hypothetical protein
VHHFDSAACQAERNGPQGALAAPVHEVIEAGYNIFCKFRERRLPSAQPKSAKHPGWSPTGAVSGSGVAVHQVRDVAALRDWQLLLGLSLSAVHLRGGLERPRGSGDRRLRGGGRTAAQKLGANAEHGGDRLRALDCNRAKARTVWGRPHQRNLRSGGFHRGEVQPSSMLMATPIPSQKQVCLSGVAAKL